MTVEPQKNSIRNYNSENIQALMELLAKINHKYISEENGIIYSKVYNPVTQTFYIENISFTTPFTST